MVRGLLVLLLAGALGAGVIYLLDPGGDDDTSIGEYGGDGGAPDDDLAAALEGSGTELIDEPEILEREKTELQGRVVDAEGEPLGGIKVAAYFQNPNWKRPIQGGTRLSPTRCIAPASHREAAPPEGARAGCHRDEQRGRDLHTAPRRGRLLQDQGARGRAALHDVHDLEHRDPLGTAPPRHPRPDGQAAPRATAG